jgi:hypothetical protein
MPKRKDGTPVTEVVKVRIATELRLKAENARKVGAHAEDAESSFLGYLLKIGLYKYEKQILPLEQGEDLTAIS